MISRTRIATGCYHRPVARYAPSRQETFEPSRFSMGASSRTALIVLALATWFVLGCSDNKTAPPARVPVAASASGAATGTDTVQLTVLYTTDEHGWIKPHQYEGARRGGVAQLLRQLTTEEQHCAGRLPPLPVSSAVTDSAALGPPSGTAPGAAVACKDSRTLLLSGGDNFTGPAISGLFRGSSMSAAQARLGYAASAFGNHEFDYGLPQFAINRRLAGFDYLAANLLRDDGQLASAYARAFTIIERSGVKLGVVGVATPKTPQTAAPQRFVGLRFEALEPALERVIPQVWNAGADAVVLIAHECHSELEPIIERHPEWGLLFVAAGHCHRTSAELVGDVPLINPGWRMEHYARIRLQVRLTGPARQRAQVLSYELIEVASAADRPAPQADEALEQRIAGWQRAVDRALGEVIGYAAGSLARDSAAIGQWITGAWREQFKVDVAITTQGAVRQSLTAGDITLAKLYSIMPFENELIRCSIPGSALLEALGHRKTVAAGVRRRANRSWVLANGKSIDPTKSYSIITSDFLYYGGDDFRFGSYDKTPTFTGVGWREPVIAWTKAQKTSKARPLERALHRGRSGAAAKTTGPGQPVPDPFDPNNNL